VADSTGVSPTSRWGFGRGNRNTAQTLHAILDPLEAHGREFCAGWVAPTVTESASAPVRAASTAERGAARDPPARRAHLVGERLAGEMVISSAGKGTQSAFAAAASHSALAHGRGPLRQRLARCSSAAMTRPATRPTPYRAFGPRRLPPVTRCRPPSDERSGLTPFKSYGACPECSGSKAPFAQGPVRAAPPLPPSQVQTESLAAVHLRARTRRVEMAIGRSVSRTTRFGGTKRNRAMGRARRPAMPRRRHVS
jgi:hypothetical protein